MIISYNYTGTFGTVQKTAHIDLRKEKVTGWKLFALKVTAGTSDCLLLNSESKCGGRTCHNSRVIELADAHNPTEAIKYLRDNHSNLENT